METDSDEYHTAISTIVTTDSDVVVTSNKLFDASKNDSKAKGYRQLNQVHQVEQRRSSDFVHKTNDTFDSANRLTEKNKQLRKSFDNSKQTSQQHEHLNVLDTKNRCDTIYRANGSNSVTQQQQQHRRLGNATAWSKSHEQITHKFSRRSTRNSLENKAPLSSCCNQRLNENHPQQQHQQQQQQQLHNINSKRGLCKRFVTTDYSDSSDVNSETNLVIENMRNRECEMYRKISFNNGYFDMTDSSSSGSYMHCRSNANSVETASHHHGGIKNKKCACKTNDLVKRSPKFATKRKCRSFPLTENRQQIEINHASEQNTSENVIKNQTKSQSNSARSNNVVQTHNSETETNTYQTNSRKITITIRTKTVPEQINTNEIQQQQQSSQSIDNYLTNTCESSEESDTTVSDYATLCSESDANAKQMIECKNRNDFDVESINEPDSSSCSSDDDDNSFFSIKSDIEYQSETSQYFNCTSYTDTENMHFPTENIHVPNEDVHLSHENIEIEPKYEHKNKPNAAMNEIRTTNTTVKQTQSKNRRQNKTVAMKKSTANAGPMICIEQELCENRIVTSKIEVDKEKIKEFKRRQKKRSQPKIIIDNTFSEEIFNETLNRSAQICCDKNVIDNIVSSLEAEKCEQTPRHPTKNEKNAQNFRNKFISEDFVFDKLQASPQYTGKSIRRLLAQRIEHQSITSVRRTLLQNVAYAITEKEKLHKLEKKKMSELAPIKPPRSFTASSSSSPLSKQSFESSATIPISEMVEKRPDPAAMGFVMPCTNPNAPKYEQHVGEESSVQFGWVRPGSTMDNDELPASRYATADQFSSSTQYTQANSVQSMGFCVPKEDIDTVDSSNRSTKDFERFSAVLTESHQNNLSTPIKDFASPMNNTKYHSVEAAPAAATRVTTDTAKPTETICKNCHCKVKKEKAQYATLSKKGKRIGKAALKRTKTFIGTSKRLLTKPSTKEAKKEKKTDIVNEEVFSTPLKDGDNTVCNNRDTISEEEYRKRVNKSLNLTPKEMNQRIVELNPSPKRKAQVSNVRLLKDAAKPTLDDSEQYATPDEAFDFDRVVDLPSEQQKTIKRSPSKMISKLAKSSKKLFQMKGRDKEKRRPDTDDSPHYYKANDYDEVDNKVLIMGEMLSEMRKRIENGHGGSTSNIDEEVHERPPSAKKCLFRNRTVSTSSGDLLDQDSLVEQIATIDLHDEPEPEPLYAEIETSRSAKVQDTMYLSCRDDDVNAISSRPSEAVQLKEVYINDRNDAQPSKYIMVNNNPKILYATVNRGSMQTRSLETIESRTEQSEDQVDGENDDKKSFRLSSSYDSLDMSLINDFATAVQTELDQCQHKMNDLFTTATSEPDQTASDEVDVPKHDRKSNSGSESIATSDLNSGCSSFYRRSKRIVSNRPRKTLSDFVDTLSLDTVGTGSYCESLSRGNDLNSEIKDTITSLEYMPSEMGDSTDLSNDFAANIAFRSCVMDSNSSKDSAKVINTVFILSMSKYLIPLFFFQFVSFNRPDCDSIDSSPSSSLYRTFSKIESPTKKLLKMSPSLRAIKSKFRNSFRMDGKKSTAKNDSFATDAMGSDETSDVKSCASTSSGSSADIQRKKLFESICSRFETMPNESLAHGAQMKGLIERIRQQQEMRKSILNALEVCRTNSEFHNSRELVEAEQLMLMSSLKECSALEKLIELWQNDSKTVEKMDSLGEGVLTIKYLEFELKVDSIFDTHFNYFYVCVCSYRDQVEFTDAKERTDNRIVFNNLKMQFHDLTADFEIRVEIYALRLRKNAPTEKVDHISLDSK